MANNKEVKPCPLCDGQIQVFSIPRASHPFASGKDKWYGQCKKCKWGMGRTRKANLIKALNRRPSPWIPVTPKTMPEGPFPEEGLPILLAVFDDREPKMQCNIMWLFDGHNWKEAIVAMGYTHWQPITNNQ